ncbi:MAG: hypothetical protein R3277_11120 [Brumimicrobium sp.]|nr:hypothetical protein [Brumimicrobium sp.]
MHVNPPFYLRETFSQEVLNLLNSVTLGSSGARYRHRNIDKRIENLYRPLFLNLERNERVLGNITLCRRKEAWYIRYFAFDPAKQSAVKTKSKNRPASGRLKNMINDFFDNVLNDGESGSECLYAYIDPRNERSMWMSENFGFRKAASIASQTFSRVKPKKKTRVIRAGDRTFIKQKVKEVFADYPLYFDHHTFNETPFYELIKDGETVGFAKTHSAEWVIERLPGKKGRMLINIIPFVPGVRKVVRPKAHHFTVVDTVWLKDPNAGDFEELMEGILEKEGKNTLIWWVDKKEPLYVSLENRVNWGLLHKINGVQDVNLAVKRSDKDESVFNRPTYVTGYDFI